MTADFILPEDWRCKLENALPDTYRGLVLRGAKVMAASGDAGTIVLQTYEHPLFTIRFKCIEFLRAIKIPFTHANEKLVSLLAVKNNIHYKIKGLGLLQLKEGQLSIFHCTQQSFIASYEKNKVYHSLEIAWSTEIIKEHLPYFNLLTPFFNSRPLNKSFFLNNAVHTADSKILGIAHEILKSPYDDITSGIMFQHKSREYFFLIMVAIGRIAATGLHLTKEEWDKIDAIATMLRDNPNKKFPITGLATEAQMNPTKLKEGFKERFNSGIFEYQMVWRMQEARRLLEETNLPTKEISAHLGYRGISSFITKFREYYGYPPGKVVRKSS